jgi:hypothetical protein
MEMWVSEQMTMKCRDLLEAFQKHIVQQTENIDEMDK